MLSGRTWVVLFICLAAMPVAGNVDAQEFKPHFTYGADFLYRFDNINIENTIGRSRHQFQVHARFNAELQEDLTLGFQLRSNGADPRAAKQAMGDGFTGKAVTIDLAYFDWHPIPVKGFDFSVGKIKNPFYFPDNTELLWDNEIRPEGFSLLYNGYLNKTKLYLTTNYFIVQERATAKDAVLFGSMAGVTQPVGPANLLIDLGYFDFANAKGFIPFYNNDPSGNSVDAAGNYRQDFRELEIITETDIPNLLHATKIYFDYVKNVADGAHDTTGWLAGIGIGTCNHPGAMEIHWSYKYIEKNAVVGTFNDSCFISGGTDGKGHEVNFGYQLSTKTRGVLTYFANEKGLHNGRDYGRFQCDLNLTY